MDVERSQSGSRAGAILPIRRLYRFLAPRGYNVIMFAALFCTLAVKFFHSWRTGLVGEYFGWVLADIAVLLGIEVILALVCFFRPVKLVIRMATVIAAVVCTWSVMNAGLLIRTGVQILPMSILPLIRDPLNTLGIVGVNFAKMPIASVILLGPSAVALIFFFCVLARPRPPGYNRKSFAKKIIISVSIIVVAVAARGAVVRRGSAAIGSAGLRYNSQLKAVTSFLSGAGRVTKVDFVNAKRQIPTFDQVEVALSPAVRQINHNVVIVVLEGIQYRYSSLGNEESNLTPYLASLAKEGVEFVNARSPLSHTTKVLFSLLTGRYPSFSQDLAEAVPAEKPYGSIATILREELNFRTAFFQSAKGNFECRPGLVYNLGFEKFWAREDLGDPNAYVGYLGCDEFSMLAPISEWIKADERPFLLIILCSVTHDPYEVPEWFGSVSREPIERYRQSVLYTDRFISELNVELTRLNVADKTIFCVIGDHGEAFGEHGLLGHERIAFDEVLRIPWVIRASFLIEPARQVAKPVSSIDLTPTLLSLLGFDTSPAPRRDGTSPPRRTGFDGVDGLGDFAGERKVYFSGWMQQSPAGFVRGNRKFVYNPATGEVSVCDLRADPFELVRTELAGQRGQKIADEITGWRKKSIFRLNQQRTGEKMVFGAWLCRWNNRVCRAKYRPEAKQLIIDK